MANLKQDNLALSTELIMEIGHRKEIRKLTFQACALALRRSESDKGLAPNQPWITPERPTLGHTSIFTRVDPNQHDQRSKGAILTLPWKSIDQQDRACCLFGVTVGFDWIKLDVWLEQTFCNYSSGLKLSLGRSALVKYGTIVGFLSRGFAPNVAMVIL